MPRSATEPVLDRAVRWVLLIGGVAGFVAAFVLAVERFKLLTNPFYTPSCSINSVVSCGPVMTSPQAALFGFPNPLLGIAGFAVVITVAVVLFTGVRLPRWMWLGLQLGATAGFVLVLWLSYQSIFKIGALCPYCMVVWVATVPIFWYVTLRNVGQVSERRPVTVLTTYHSVGPIAVLLFIAGLVLTRFWLPGM